MIKHQRFTVKRVYMQFGRYSMGFFTGNNTMYMESTKEKIACNEEMDMIY